MDWIKKLTPAFIQVKSLYTVQREKTIDNELTILFGLIDDDKYVEAKKELKKLKEKYGDTVPNYQKRQVCFPF